MYNIFSKSIYYKFKKKYMADMILIEGETGTGKSYSLHTLNPKETFVICPDDKPLSFRGSKKNYVQEKSNGKIDITKSNYYITRDPEKIQKALNYVSEQRPEIKVIVLDTITMMMLSEFMGSARVKGFEKYTELALSPWQILNSITKLRDDLVIVVMAHTERDGERTRFFVPGGKLIAEKAKPAALFTVVLETQVEYSESGNKYYFLTQNNGINEAKSPAGMFETHLIPNDLSLVIQRYREYYNEESN